MLAQRKSAVYCVNLLCTVYTHFTYVVLTSPHLPAREGLSAPLFPRSLVQLNRAIGLVSREQEPLPGFYDNTPA